MRRHCLGPMGEGGLRGRALRAHCRLPDGRPQRDASWSPNPRLLVLSLRMRATQEIGLRCVRDCLGVGGPRALEIKSQEKRPAGV